MLHLFQRVAARICTLQRPTLTAARRGLHTRISVKHSVSYRPLIWGSALALSAAVAVGSSVHLDADVPPQGDTTTDPATAITFPNKLRIQSKTPLPTFTLVGVGVRTVSFIGLKVYSIGFYADLDNPNLNISKSASLEEKLDHIVRNSACVLRIMPTRSTSYGHLRDGFIRALQKRMVFCRQRGTLSPEEEAAVQSPFRKFKSMFPNTPLTKHTPLDILLTPPEAGQERTLVVRDLGAVQNDWLAREFVLTYFEGDGLSPPLKQSVAQRLESFGK